MASTAAIRNTRKLPILGRLKAREIGQGNQWARAAFAATISGRPVASIRKFVA
jgi:hypothetical protein